MSYAAKQTFTSPGTAPLFQAIRDYPECQSLDGCQGLFPGAPVNRNPWKRGDIGDPASIRLPVELDVKIEGRRSS